MKVHGPKKELAKVKDLEASALSDYMGTNPAKWLLDLALYFEEEGSGMMRVEGAHQPPPGDQADAEAQAPPQEGKATSK